MQLGSYCCLSVSDNDETAEQESLRSRYGGDYWWNVVCGVSIVASSVCYTESFEVAIGTQSVLFKVPWKWFQNIQHGSVLSVLCTPLFGHVVVLWRCDTETQASYSRKHPGHSRDHNKLRGTSRGEHHWAR